MKICSWRVDCVVGARPNFVKIAPILRELRGDARFSARLLHTGQHYDPALNAAFFAELEIPAPDVQLDAGSGTAAEQTARAMVGIEAALTQARPDLLIVVGDVNSTLAAALAASKLRVPLAHVEAGLRSFDRAMPEEINRLVVDRLADLLLTTERGARRHLLAEGCAPERIRFVGNVMIDSLHFAAPRAPQAAETLAAHGWGAGAPARREGFGLVTLHRPANVDEPAKLKALLAALERAARRLPLFFPAHPRTRAVMTRDGLGGDIDPQRLLITPPLPYLQMIALMRAARFALTDSGGVQEETTALGVPCLTFRDTTERPVTITEGGNRLIGADPAAIDEAVAQLLAAPPGPTRIPEFWDGRAARRVVAAIAEFLARAAPGSA